MITDRQIKAAITGVRNGKRSWLLRDPGERGGGRLTLTVRAGKRRVTAEWYVTYQRRGERRSIKLGEYPTVTLAAARKQFREDYQPAILAGRDPLGPRAWRRPGVPTMRQLAEAYVSDLEAKGKPGASRFHYVLLAPGGAVEAIGADKPLSTITPDDIWPHIKSIYDRGKGPYARYVRATLRSCFQYALRSRYSATAMHAGTDWGIRQNPVDLIDHIPRGHARRRVLSPIEFRALWFWLDGIRHRQRYRNAAALMLMMLTGQRPSEILGLRAEQFDATEGALSWETTKNGRGHDIPICRQAIVLLKDLQPNEHGLYFPRQRLPHQPLIADSAAVYIEKFIKDTGGPPFQLRDLRRTWKSLATEAGIPKVACDRLQNHALADVSERYYVHSQHWGLKAPAIEAWAVVVDHLLYSEDVITRRTLGRLPEVLRLTARIVDED